MQLSLLSSSSAHCGFECSYQTLFFFSLLLSDHFSPLEFKSSGLYNFFDYNFESSSILQHEDALEWLQVNVMIIEGRISLGHIAPVKQRDLKASGSW